MSKHKPWRPFRLSDSQAHAEIMRLAEDKRSLDVRDEFQNDPQRLTKFSRELDGVYIDMSKQRWDDEVFEALQHLAQEADVQGAIDDLFAGVKLNTTEDRAVLHMALRAEKGDRFLVDGQDVVEDVLRVRQDMLRFVDQVHELHATGAITDVVNIGIGGSD